MFGNLHNRLHYLNKTDRFVEEMKMFYFIIVVVMAMEVQDHGSDISK